MSKQKYTYDDAEDIIYWAGRNPSSATVESLVRAGETLLRESERLAKELEYSEASVQQAGKTTGRQVARGGELELGRDSGGLRHYLNGRSVSAGSRLHLLTHIGWLPGRYEWTFNPEHTPTFHLALPGCGSHQVSVCLPQGARLAWDDEVKGK